MARSFSGRRGSSRPRAPSRASTTSGGTERATPTARRATRSRSPRALCRSPTSSTRLRQSVRTRRPGRLKPVSRRSKPEPESASIRRSSLGLWLSPAKASSSGSAPRSPRRRTTSTSEAQPSKSGPRGEAREHGQRDEDGEREHKEVPQAVPRKHLADVAAHEKRPNRAANESGRGTHGDAGRDGDALGTARPREQDAGRDVDRAREHDARERQPRAAPAQVRLGAAGQLRELLVAENRLDRADAHKRQDRDKDEPHAHAGTIRREACSVKRGARNRFADARAGAGPPVSRSPRHEDSGRVAGSCRALPGMRPLEKRDADGLRRRPSNGEGGVRGRAARG